MDIARPFCISRLVSYCLVPLISFVPFDSVFVFVCVFGVLYVFVFVLLLIFAVITNMTFV
jgi:hypothetical protein